MVYIGDCINGFEFVYENPLPCFRYLHIGPHTLNIGVLKPAELVHRDLHCSSVFGFVEAKDRRFSNGEQWTKSVSLKITTPDA